MAKSSTRRLRVLPAFQQRVAKAKAAETQARAKLARKKMEEEAGRVELEHQARFENHLKNRPDLVFKRGLLEDVNREIAKVDGLEKRRAALEANLTDLRAQARRKRLCEQSKPDTIALAEGMSKLWEQRLQTIRARKGTPKYRMVDEIFAEESAIRFAKIARDLRAPQREKERQQTALEQKEWLEATRAVRPAGKGLRKKLRAGQVEWNQGLVNKWRNAQRAVNKAQAQKEAEEGERTKRIAALAEEKRQRGMTASRAVEPKAEPGEISLTQGTIIKKPKIETEATDITEELKSAVDSLPRGMPKAEAAQRKAESNERAGLREQIAAEQTARQTAEQKERADEDTRKSMARPAPKPGIWQRLFSRKKRSLRKEKKTD